MTDLEAAWEAVHAALERLPDWRAGSPQYLEHAGVWMVVAMDARRLPRGTARESIEITAATEEGALVELATRLEARAG